MYNSNLLYWYWRLIEHAGSCDIYARSRCIYSMICRTGVRHIFAVKFPEIANKAIVQVVLRATVNRPEVEMAELESYALKTFAEYQGSLVSSLTSYTLANLEHPKHNLASDAL